MTNEEIAVQIQQGRTDLYLQLWENVKRLIVQEAEKRYFINGGRGGVEIEDLVQCGFLALVSSVRYFDISSGWKFTTYLTKTLHTAISLDAPLDDDDDGTYYDLIEDPNGNFEDKAIEQTWLADLRQELRKALAAIPEDQSEMIQMRYGKGLSVDQISKSRSIDPKAVRSLESKALHSLRRPQIRSRLERFVDDETPYYEKWGLHAYSLTGMSAVEHLAIKREAIRNQYQRENTIPEITLWKKRLEVKFWKSRTMGVLRI